MTTSRTPRPRRAALAALAVVATVLAGCGGTTSPTTGGTVEPASGTNPVTEVPDDFPLADGLPDSNGDDGSPVAVVDQPGWDDLELCGVLTWSPDSPVPTTDVAGATYTGEAEDVRSRTLAVYADEGSATDALTALRDGVAGCPAAETGGTEQVFEEVGGDRDSATFTHRYRTDGRFDTGLEVVQAVRRGNALLLASYYGEGGGSEGTIRSSIDLAAEESAGVVEAMGVAFDPRADPSDSPRSPAPDPATDGAGLGEDLADFPLDDGWPTGLTEDGDDGREGPGRQVEPVVLDPCRTAADDSAVTSALHASYSDAEDYRRRSLLVFATADDAVAFVENARAVVAACPVDDSTDDGFTYPWEVRPTEVGGQSFAAVNNNAFQNAPGIYLYVVHVVRVGRAVLLDSESNEGGGSVAAHTATIEAMTAASAPVVAAMCRFTEAGC